MFPVSRRSIHPNTLSRSRSPTSVLPPRRPSSFESVCRSHLTLPNHSRPSFVFRSTQHAFSVSARVSNLSAARSDPNETSTNEAEKDSSKPKTKPFSDIKSLISPALYHAITQEPFGYSRMSAVQEKLLSHLPNVIQSSENAQSKTQDLLVKAKTDTGKILAFLILAIESRLRDLQAEKVRFRKQNPNSSHEQFSLHMRRHETETTGAVVISPTRELASQIAQEAVKLTSLVKLFGVRLFVGGGGQGVQLREWDNGRRDIVIATPRRLNDVLNSSPSVRTNLSTTRTLIIDEADTLLEMGFKEEIDKVVQQLPPKEDRSTYLFSATISPEVQQIASKTLKQHTKMIDCVPTGETNIHAHVPQYYTVLPNPADQITHLFNLIAQDQLINPNGKTIIFLPTTKMIEMFSQLINSFTRHLPWNSPDVTKVYELHGSRSPKERESITRDFRDRAGVVYQILVTSDVSARGVDYPGVTRVIQMGVPTTRDIYVHRVGRTGRAGKAGRGDLILLDWERNYVRNVLRDLPLKLMPVSDLKKDLMDLASKIDETGEAPTITRRTNKNSLIKDSQSKNKQSKSRESTPAAESISMSLPVVDRLQSFSGSVKESIIPCLEDKAIQDSFGSLLGYYASKTSDIGETKEKILNGLKHWAIEGMLLAEEPQVSPTFLQNSGFTKERKVSTFGVDGWTGNTWGNPVRNDIIRDGSDIWSRGGVHDIYFEEDRNNPIYMRAVREIEDMFGNTGGYYGNASRAFKAGIDIPPKSNKPSNR